MVVNRWNAEAGDTPEPTREMDIALAEKTADIVWRAVPYFGLRYGDRGRAFGRSDSGWLVTLVSLPGHARNAQLEWLTRILAPRGMPSWLLEVQLRATLQVGKRWGWEGEGALRGGLDYLIECRRAVLEEPLFHQAGALFAERAAGAKHAFGTGCLVASSVIDAALERSDSSEAVSRWFEEARSVPATWALAAQEVRGFVESALVARTTQRHSIASDA